MFARSGAVAERGTTAARPAENVSCPKSKIIPGLFVAVMFGTFMEVLDSTWSTCPCPTFRQSVGTVDEATWVLTSYLVSNAIILPMTGWLANYFGRKRILLLSVGGFTVCSWLAAWRPAFPC